MATSQSAQPATSSAAERERRSLLTARIRVPQHVVYRSFPSETVVLNLQTGKYHGLNPTAGAMLATLDRAGGIRGAAAELAQQYARPRSEVEGDICSLCSALLERGLVELDDPAVG